MGRLRIASHLPGQALATGTRLPTIGGSVRVTPDEADHTARQGSSCLKELIADYALGIAGR